MTDSLLWHGIMSLAGIVDDEQMIRESLEDVLGEASAATFLQWLGDIGAEEIREEGR